MYESGSSGDSLRSEQQARESSIRESAKQVEGVFSEYGPSFYKAREQAYLNYALPKLAQQYQEAGKNLVYNMANKGLLQSSVAGTLASSLEQNKTEKQQAIADQAIAEGNQLRTQVEQGRQQALSSALAGLEPSLAYSNAIETASRASTPSPFQPVGQLFQDWSNVYLAKKMTDAYGPNTAAALTYSQGKAPVRTIN